MAYPIIESNIGNDIMVNHKIISVDNDIVKDLFLPNYDLKFYEVIRCIDGVMLFLEDHLDRLYLSIKNKITLDIMKLKEDIKYFIKHKNIRNGNLRIVVTEKYQIIYENQYYYPTKSQYENGVLTGLIKWEREDPNVKAVRNDYKVVIAKKLSEEGPYGKYFETLLFGNDGFITEGSRSNVFFVEDRKVYSAPDDEILLGITRKYVVKAIKNAGGELIIKKISSNLSSEINNIDAAFLSGTSIGVLPISAIEKHQLSSATNLLVNKISEEYNKIVSEYIISNK